MSFGIPVRNGLAIGLLASTALSSRSGRNSVASLILNFTDGIYRALGMNYNFSDIITFSRTTNATLVDATGKLTYAPNNLVLRSEEFNDAAWSKTALTITPNATSAPNGTTTADKLVEDTATSGHFVAPAVSPSGSLGQSYVYSVYVKAAERTFLQIILTGIGPASGNLIAGFNLANGTVGTPSATVVSTITDAGNGWFRCSAAFPISTAGSFTAQLRVALNSTATPSSYTGDGVSGLFIWGAQLEQVTYQTAPSTYVQTVASAYYGPRFDYNPSTLASNGLLIEEQRVNSLLYSDQFDQATWTKAGATISPNITVSPDGTSNADKLVEDSTTGQHRFFRTATGTTNTNAYTVSFFAKAGERTRIYIGLAESPTFVRQGNAVFDLSAGTVVNASAGSGGASGGSATIQAFPNGWYRCTYTLTLGGTDTSIFNDVNLVSTGTTISYTGNGVSGAFVYGAQLEAGAFATSYIPTVASTVTRTADVAVMTGTNFSSWYNQTEGTIVVQATAYGNKASSILTRIQDAAATTNFITARQSATGTQILGQTSSSGGLTAGLASTNFTIGVPFKIAVASAPSDVAASVNGGTVGTSTAMTTMPVVDRLNISEGGPFYVRQITYYPTRLTNAQLQALTT